MKKVLVVAAALILVSGMAYAGNFAVQGGYLLGTGIGGGIKVGILEVGVGLPTFGGIPIGGGVLFDLMTIPVDKYKLVVSAGGNFTYFVGAPASMWTAMGKADVDFFITDQFSVFGGFGAGVAMVDLSSLLAAWGFTGTVAPVMAPTYGGEAGIRYYLN